MKKLFVYISLLAAVAGILLTGCSSGTPGKSSKGNSDSKVTESYVAKYADNEFYAKSVELLKKEVGLNEQQADEAFGVLFDCGLITDNISYVFQNTDYKTGKTKCYNIWVKLNEYEVFFDDDGKITKITDNLEKTLYENGVKIDEPSTVEGTTKAAAEKPVETTTESKVDFSITSYPLSVNPGEMATVEVSGAPNTKYFISVTYDTTKSTAEGLEPKISDSNGYVSWEWKVGSGTTSDDCLVEVSNETGKLQATIKINQ